MGRYNNQFDNYYNQIANKSKFGYTEAQEYYVKLKNQMLNLMNKNLSKIEKTAVDNFNQTTADSIFEEILKGPLESSETQAKEAKKILQEVESIVQNYIGSSKDKTGLSQQKRKTAKHKAIETIKSVMDYKNKHPEAYKNSGEKQAFTNRFIQLMNKSKSNVLDGLLEQVRALKKDQITDTKVRTALETYAVRLFAKELTKSSKDFKDFFANMSSNSYINLLKGLAREAAVESALNKVYQQAQRNNNSNKTTDKIVLKVGDKSNIAGQETSIDLLINACFNEEKTLDVFNKQYLAQIDLDIDEEIRSVLNGTSESVVFGAQVKSFDITNGDFIGGLGHQSILRNTLLSSSIYGNGYSLVGNIAFMGLRQNIVKTLGERNVLFIDGANKYWMPDFIQAFRSKDLYLMLKTEKKEQNKYIVTSEVALYNYMAAKTHRGQDFYSKH